MSRSDIDLVVFDAGGVLLRICRSWEEACQQAGEPFHPSMMTPELMAKRKALAKTYEIGGLVCEDFFAALAATTDGLYTPAQVRRVHEAWIIEEYAGVSDLIRDLHRAGVPTALLSNTNQTHWEQFPNFPVMRRLRDRHSGSLLASHLLRCAKPDQTIYQRCAEETETTSSRILFFDDLPENIAGAQGAGWQADLVDFRADTAAQMRTFLGLRGVL